MLTTRLHVVPIFIVIFVPVSFLITYIIAVYNKHVEPGFPYISDTGTLPPESCVFGLLLNFGAVVAMVMFYIRYKQISTYQTEIDRPDRVLTNVNKAALGAGLLSAFGISVVGNFQETNVQIVHLFGAFLAFGFGIVYSCLQTYLSFKLPEIPGSTRSIRRGRAVICVLDVVFLIILVVATPVAFQDRPTNPRKWTPDEPGYGPHLTSTISEWIIAFLVCLYLATFTPEFKYFELIKPTISFREIPSKIVDVEGRSQDTEPQTNGLPVTLTQTDDKY